MHPFAVIFDVNGTLIDTERAHFEGYHEALEAEGVRMTLQQFTDIWSRRGGKITDYLQSIGRTDLLPNAERIKRRKDEIFQATLAERIKLLPGAMEILETLRRANVPLGLDTSGSENNLEVMFSLFDLRRFFAHVATGDTPIDEARYGSRRQKASRLKYLADQLGLPPARCVMVGDAEKDVVGARGAGMRCIAIPNVFTSTHDFSSADVILESLSELKIEVLERLVS